MSEPGALQHWAELTAAVGLEAALARIPRPAGETGRPLRMSTGALIEQGGDWLFALSVLGPAALVPGRVVLFGLGGRPEPGERLFQAVEREVREEAGLHGTAVDSFETLVFNTPCPSGIPDAPAAPAQPVRLTAHLAPRPAYIWCYGAGSPAWWRYGVDLSGYVCAVYLVRANLAGRLRAMADEGVHGWAWASAQALRATGSAAKPVRGEPGLLTLAAGSPGVRVAGEGRAVAPGTSLVLVGSATFVPSWLEQTGRPHPRRPAR